MADVKDNDGPAMLHDRPADPYHNNRAKALRALLSAARRLDSGVKGWIVKNADGELIPGALAFGKPYAEDYCTMPGDEVVPVLIVPAEEPAGE